ncbi:MAG: hypothetical protein ACRDP1_06870 [Nocardioidaceae bacterium]
MKSPHDDFEDRLRHALRDQRDGRTDTDAWLRDIRRGSRRRVARRRTGVAGVVAVAAVAAGVVVVPSILNGSGNPPIPVASGSTSTTFTTPPPTPVGVAKPGDPIAATGLRAVSLTADSKDQFWVHGTASCGDSSCPVIAHTTDGGAHFDTTLAPQIPGGALGLRYDYTGRNGWLFGLDVYATHDGGHSWHMATPPGATMVRDLQVWGGTVWAFGTGDRRDGSEQVWSAPIGSDTWTRHRVPQLEVLGAMGWFNTQVVGDGVTGGVLTGASGSRFVSSTDGGRTWRSRAIDCSNPTGSGPAGSSGTNVGASSASSHVLWIGCGNHLLVSTDTGRHWSRVSLAGVHGRTMPNLAGVDATRAVYTVGSRIYTLSTSSAPTPSTNPFPHMRDGRFRGYFAYAGFTTGKVGYLVSSDGRLARSTDSGRTWSVVALP